MSRPGMLPDLTLVGVTMIWGVTFLVIKIGLQWSGPFAFLGIRFAVAALILAGVTGRSLGRLTRAEVRSGVAIGVMIAAGFAFQTAGLQYIESSRSAFFTALYVPLVPLIEWLVLRRALATSNWVGVALAFAGLVCISDPHGLSLAIGKGEVLTLLCAVTTAVEIPMIGALTQGNDPRRMAVVQLGTAAVLSFAAMAVAHEGLPRFTPGYLACACGLGLASSFIQAALNWAQKTVSATRTTVIFTLEPVWAGIVGWLAGDRLTPLGLAGAALIVAGVLASELKWPSKEPRHVPQ